LIARVIISGKGAKMKSCKDEKMQSAQGNLNRWFRKYFAIRFILNTKKAAGKATANFDPT